MSYIGRSLGKYRILSELGSGGMGTVYLAERAGERFALKVVHPHLLDRPGMFQRFFTEVELGRKVRHPNVVRCLECDQVQEEGATHTFMVMEYVAGDTLEDFIQVMEEVPEELCRHIGREISKGLIAIHAAGAVHRDLKPPNVLITPGHEVKITDLGVASVAGLELRLTETADFLGSVLYAAPEHLTPLKIDARTDLFSLGVLLYEMSSRVLPHPGTSAMEVMSNVLTHEPEPLGERNRRISPFFEEVVLTLLRKKQEERFESAEELLEILEQGEDSAWWKQRSEELLARTKRPLRRIRLPRETAVYGREESIAEIQALFEKSRGGSGQVVLIEGEAGIGKTRLVEEAIRQVREGDPDLNLLVGSYPNSGAATASGAWSTAFREMLGNSGSARYLRDTPTLVPAFNALLRGEPPPRDSEALDRESIETLFVNATRGLSRERMTVVLIEDLHFAPEEGRAMFAALAHAVPGHRILLIGTTRPGLPPEWLADFEELRQATPLQVHRLNAAQIKDLLKEALRSDALAEELAPRIALKSDGNPYFAFEILRHLRETRVIVRDADGSWVCTRELRALEIPPSVEALIQARVGVLDSKDRELLEVASCCGFEFDPRLVGEVLQLDEIQTVLTLSRLSSEHRLVHSTGRRFLFDHHLVREVLYDGIALEDLARHHAAIGSAIESRGEHPDGATAVDLCEHFLRGGEAERALPYLKAALDHLGEGHQNDQEIALANRALDIPGLLRGSERLEVLFKKNGRLHTLGRRKDQAAVLLEAGDLISEVGNDSHQVHVLRAKGLVRLRTGDASGALEHFRKSLELSLRIGDREAEGRSNGLIGEVHYSLGQYEEAEQRFLRHQEISRQIHDPRGEARATGNLGIVLWSQGRYEEASRSHQRHLELSREVGNRRGQSRAMGNLGFVFWSRGLWKEARVHHEQSLELSRQSGHRLGMAQALGGIGLVLCSLGRYRESLDHHTRHRAICCEIANREGEGIATGALGNVYTALGCYRQARMYHARALIIAREIGDSREQGYFLQGLGEDSAGAADIDDARCRFEEALEIREQIGFRPGVAESLLSLGRLDRQAARTRIAVRRIRRALDIAREIDIPGVEVLALAHLAASGEAETAELLTAMESRSARMCHHERIEARFLAFGVTGDPRHLQQAYDLLSYLRTHAPEEYRDGLTRNIPLYQQVQETWEEQREAG